MNEFDNYDWEGEAAKNGMAPRLPDGQHRVQVVKVLHEGKSGSFRSQDGDPQMLVIVADDQEREASIMFTLSRKAGWALAKFLKACKADLKRMTEAKITPDRFTDPRFAQAQLIGRKLVVHVQTQTNAETGKSYQQVIPVVEDPKAKTQAADEDEIPF